MKIRNGFVTNSSSSTFVVAFPRKPESADDVHKMLFTGRKELSAYDEAVSTIDAAQYIFDCIGSQEPNEVSKIGEELESNSGRYRRDFMGLDGKFDDDRFEAWLSEQVTLRATQWLKQYPGHFTYIFRFSDNSGNIEATLEHGDTFMDVPHEVISHH